jgi:hypothetical protein
MIFDLSRADIAGLALGGASTLPKLLPPTHARMRVNRSTRAFRVKLLQPDIRHCRNGSTKIDLCVEKPRWLLLALGPPLRASAVDRAAP